MISVDNLARCGLCQPYKDLADQFRFFDKDPAVGRSEPYPTGLTASPIAVNTDITFLSVSSTGCVGF